MKKKVLFFSIFLLINVVFIDFVCAETYNNYEVGTASCGSDLLTGIPVLLPKIVSIIYKVIQVAIPVVLVIMGSIDLIKGITASKEDDIKKGQQMFIKRLIAAVLIFFVFVVVKFLISLVADNDSKRTAVKIMDCAECFIENNCKVKK